MKGLAWRPNYKIPGMYRKADSLLISKIPLKQHQASACVGVSFFDCYMYLYTFSDGYLFCCVAPQIFKSSMLCPLLARWGGGLSPFSDATVYIPAILIWCMVCIWEKGEKCSFRKIKFLVCSMWATEKHMVQSYYKLTICTPMRICSCISRSVVCITV